MTGQPGGGWVVAVEGGHVRATAVFVHRGGKTKQARGELTVDGEPRPLAHSWEQLREIWDEHEGNRAAAPAGLMVIEDPGTRPVPGSVRTAAGIIEKRTSGAVPVRTGVNGAHWVIGVDGRDGDGLRFVFTRDGQSWVPDKGRPLQVIVGGEDKSADAEGDMAKAMAIALSGYPQETAASTAGGHQQAGFRDTGVETRRMVVKRELPPCPPTAPAPSQQEPASPRRGTPALRVPAPST